MEPPITIGDAVRLASALVRDALAGIALAGGSPVAVPRSPQRPALDSEDEAARMSWPPTIGQFDGQGQSRALGELARAFLALTYQEPRAVLRALAHSTPPNPAQLVQLHRAFQALSVSVAAQPWSLAEWGRFWRGIFSFEQWRQALATLQATPPQIPLATSAPPNVAAASAAGNAGIAAQADHTHGHGNQAGGSLHALATGAADGFLSSANFTKLAGIENGATKDSIATSAPPNIAAGSSLGASTKYAREDHTHGHGSQAGGTLHDIASAGQSGFMSSVQVTKLQDIQDGATKAAQTVGVYAEKGNDLLASSTIGTSGAVRLFGPECVPDVCLIGGLLGDFRVEANSAAPNPIALTVFRAPSGSTTYGATGITVNVAKGALSGSSAGTETVAAGDRLIGFSSGPWAHGGLTMRGRIKP